jgi:hypothetical protein
MASASFRLFLFDLNVWRHELRADQPHLMTKIGEHASPIVRPVRSLHADQTRRQIGEEAGHRIATQPLSHNDFPVLVDAVNLEEPRISIWARTPLISALRASNG